MIDWKEDPWFVKHHYSQLTKAFKDWWLSYYGPSIQFGEDENERHEYWVRCAFALAGWSAARKREEALTMTKEEMAALRCKVSLEEILKQINLGVK